MQKCEHLKENLTLYTYGELDPVTGREVENHLKSCEGCRQEHRRLSTILAKVKQASAAPQLSPWEARAMASDISRKLKAGSRRTWWRQYLDLTPSRLIPAAVITAALIIAVAVIGYLNLSRTAGMPPVSMNQNEELMLSDKDMEILDNLELLKEMESIQKLSQLVDTNGKTDSQWDRDNDTRGMRQDGYRHYSV
jgi:hypothetical protein